MDFWMYTVSLWHWLILLVVIALLFLPGGPGDMMRGK